MKKIKEVRERIRFNLDQLRSKNAHHEFEHLCREFSKQRICRNILPATGPVAAGGDQGRDFETYRTYLSQNGTSLFQGKHGDKDIFFACTLQKENVGKKIKDDLNSIFSKTEVRRPVVYFCIEEIGDLYRMYYEALAQVLSLGRRLEISGPFNIVWPKILASSEHLSLFKKLRDEGFKDWHIMLILGNAFTNNLANKLIPKNISQRESMDRHKAFMQNFTSGKYDKEFSETDISEISIKDLERTTEMTFLSIMKTWDLTLHQFCPCIEGVKKFMATRYHLFEFDAPHDPILWEVIPPA